MSVLRTIVLFLIAAVALSVNGATIGTDAASQAASRFLSSGQLARINASPVTVKLVYKEPSAVHASAVDYYVFNTVDEDAFVIIAGDDPIGIRSNTRVNIRIGVLAACESTEYRAQNTDR